LTVAVIVLFIGLAIQPSVAVTQKEAITVSPLNPDETRYLANLSMDFGENITNNMIEYEKGVNRYYGDWTVNVRLKFRCPENLKIIVTYYYFAELINFNLGDVFTFCNVRETVTIVNGSNPPDIEIDYTELIYGGYNTHFRIYLKLRGILDIYEFVDGEWVYLDGDYFYDEIIDNFEFNRIRPSERTKTSDDDCNLCPKKVSKSHIVLIKSLLNRLEKYDTQLSVLSKLNSELDEKYKDFNDNFFICFIIVILFYPLTFLLNILAPLKWYPSKIILVNIYAILMRLDDNFQCIDWFP
jgi:hypothetical protein